MNPANSGELLHRPHVYVKRPDGSSGYEPVVDPVILPSAADLDAVAAEAKARDTTAKPALVKPLPAKAVGK